MGNSGRRNEGERKPDGKSWKFAVLRKRAVKGMVDEWSSLEKAKKRG